MVGQTDRCVRCGENIATAIAQASVGSGLPQMPSGMPSMQDVIARAGDRVIASRPQSARKMMLLVVAAIVGIVAITIGVFVVKRRLGLQASKGNLALAALGLDLAHGDPDKMIVAVGEPARRWARDAVWWSINLQNLRPDGTIDIDAGGAAVTYLSPSRVQSLLPKERKDSVKKFSFGGAGVSWSAITGVPRRWTEVHPPAAPGCSIKQVAELLHGRGLVAGKTVHLLFDPELNRMVGAPAQDSWHVTSADPELDIWFSMADCSVTKSKN